MGAGGGGGDFKVVEGAAGADAATGGAVEEAELHEIGLVDLFDSRGLFVDGGGDGVDADGATGVLVENREHDFLVDFIEAEAVDFEEIEGGHGDGEGDVAVGADLGVVADAAEEAVGDTRGAAGTAGDFTGGFGDDRELHEAGGAEDDGGEVFFVVMVQAKNKAEATAEGGGDEALAGGGADGGEALNGEGVGAGAGSGADHDVDAEVFEGGVENLFDVGEEAVDFVDEEDLACLNVCENAGEVEFFLEDGGGGLFEGDFEFLGDELGEGGFAEAGGAVEKNVIHGIAALAGGFDGDGEIFLELGLAGEIGEAARAERCLEFFIFFVL